MPTRTHKLGGPLAPHLAYYLAPGEQRFDIAWGRLATSLGLASGVNAAQFAALWRGEVDGDQVVTPGARRRDPESGELSWKPRWSVIDVVSSAPKSVSELLVSASPDERARIAQAWLEANRVGFETAIEGSARLARVPIARAPGVTKQQGSRTERRPADLIALPLVEFTARPTAEQTARGAPPDPHLHLHLLVMTLCRRGGRYYTTDEYGLKERTNSIYRDQVVSGEFARRLEGLGYQLDYAEWNRARGGIVAWEVKGSNPALRRYWSSNHRRSFAVRREFERRTGRPMPDRLLNVELGLSRRAKSAADKRQDRTPDWDAWADDARAHGLRVPVFTRRHVPRDRLTDRAALERRLFSPSGLHLQGALFTRADLAAAVARAAVGLGFTQDELTAVQARLEPTLIRARRAPDRRLDLLTTPALLAAEARISACLEQLDAEHGLLNLIGRSGTGKTTVVAAAVAQARHRRSRAPLDHKQQAVAARIIALLPDGPDVVIVTSVAATTAERSARKIAADAHGSIESLCAQLDRGSVRLSKRSLVVVDETSQLDTFRADELLRRLMPSGARLLLVGDPRQLQAIGPSGWWQPVLGQRETHELTAVHRQADALDVATLELFREGEAQEALARLDERGRLHVAETRVAKAEAVLAAYRHALDVGETPADVRIIVGTNNREVDEFNRLIQTELQGRGLIGQQRLIAAQRDQQRTFEYHEGDQVLFVAPYDVRALGRIRNGVTGQIVALDEDSGSVRIRLAEPKARSGRHAALADPVDVTVALHPHPLVQPLGLAYAQHVSRLAGDEVRTTLEVPGPTTDAHQAYSAHGRHTLASTVFLDRETFGPDPVRAAALVMASRAEKATAHASLNRAPDRSPEGLTPTGDTMRHLPLARANPRERANLRRRSDPPEPILRR